eukprot:CAMPEP_0175420192 /NCGR_PEP_ID=MMETSP0095-20121207/46613_1 /TAXON_ID=311494 /ORGANISM="Alexandrium monilatum, Strain CCMP3105" /LENGTH=77 /DNA_ID=CAMNT_0016719397 /DNA_START=86 /DNA_END=315 /DNA_ORIENTATION=+
MSGWFRRGARFARRALLCGAYVRLERPAPSLRTQKLEDSSPSFPRAGGVRSHRRAGTELQTCTCTRRRCLALARAGA